MFGVRWGVVARYEEHVARQPLGFCRSVLARFSDRRTEECRAASRQGLRGGPGLSMLTRCSPPYSIDCESVVLVETDIRTNV